MARFALPTIQKGGAARLATPNPMLPLKEAAARGSMLNAITGSAQAVVGLAVSAAKRADRYTEMENRREVQEASMFVHAADTAFVASNKGKEEYSIMETDDPNFYDLVDGLGIEDPGSSVPSHRVYAEWRQKNYDDALSEAALKISDPSSKNDFMAAHEMKSQSNYASDAVRSTKEQIAYSAKKTMESVDSSILNRDFIGARLAVTTSSMSEEAQSRAIKGIDTREQTDYFNEVIENRDLGMMTGALKQLHTNDAKTTSNLDATSQKILANQLRTAINMENTAINSAVNSRTQIQLADAKTQIADIWANKPVDMTEYLANYNDIKAKHPVVAREMEWTVNNQPEISKLMLEHPSLQMNQLADLKKKSSGGREDSYKINQMEKAIEAGQIARRSDSTKWGKETGFVTYDPIDYGSMESIGDSLTARVQPILSIQRRFGSFTGFLEKDELIEFGGRLENAPNKLEYFATINESLEGYAESFYEQLKEFNIGETAALAGQIMTWGEGYRPVAENILKGSNLRKTDNLTQLKMKEVSSELDAFAVQRFGGMFTGNLTQQSISIEAFKDIYAVTGDKEEAFNQVTGGTIELNGYTIQAPVPNMSAWAYKSYLKDLAPAYWKAPQMRAYGFTPDQLQKGIIGGTLRQAGTAKGVAYLETSGGMRVKQPDGVTDFLFKFDPDAPTKSGSAAKEWQATEEDVRRTAWEDLDNEAVSR